MTNSEFVAKYIGRRVRVIVKCVPNCNVCEKRIGLEGIVESIQGDEFISVALDNTTDYTIFSVNQLVPIEQSKVEPLPLPG